MANGEDPVHVLEEHEARPLLGQQTLGRLIERVGDIIEVFPINFWSDGERIVFRTAPGTKLMGLLVADEILFQVDRVEGDEAWSVVARCTAREIEDRDEYAKATELKLKPLIPTVKLHFVELKVDSITGRRFNIGDEPEEQPETVS